MSLRKGIVVAVHPDDHSVDLVMADDGSRLTGVQVMTGNGSTRTGTVDLPEIPERKDKWDVSQQTGQDMHAVVGFIGRNPVVTGFLYPQVNQLLSKDPKLRISRHQSDVISTIDGDGNIQLEHPSGLFLRIGSAPEKRDFAGKNADASSKVDRNTASKPYVRLSMPGGAAVLTIAPDGAVTLTTETTISATAKGNVTVKTEADMLLEATGSATLKAQKIILDGDTKVTKTLTVEGDTAVKAITSNGKDISDAHTHEEVRTGTDKSGKVS